MQFRQKLIFLAIAPLVVALCVIALFVHQQSVTLARQQHAALQQAYLAGKQAELRHDVERASHAIAHLTASGRCDPATLAEARRILQALGAGNDDTVFVYDIHGRNLMHPRQPELVGRDMWNLRDQFGAPTIQNIVAAARHGGGLVRYNWIKPATGQAAPKLGYVVEVPAWGWVLGSGVYLDDMQAALAALDARQSEDSAATMWWIAGVAVAAMLATLAIGGAGLVLNLGAARVADAKLKALAQRVVDSQEQERARLSRDLHDGISQGLVSIKLMIEAALSGLGGGTAQQSGARADFVQAAAELDKVLGEVRRISHDLRPALLDDLGLTAALDSLAQDYTRHSKAPVAFLSFGQPERLPDAIGTVLFRIAQEALTNIERHAGARRIDMSLGTRGGRVLLTIADDGAGFDAKSVDTHPRRGIGLRNMAERMDAIGGLLAIASSPAGTIVRASVALEA